MTKCFNVLNFPVDANAESEKGGKRRKKKLVETHGKDRERQRYFADDDKFDLKTMFEREKLSTAEDQNAMLSRCKLYLCHICLILFCFCNY